MITHDVAAAVQRVRRTPAFSSTAILTLAIGIGLATAVWSVAEVVVIRPLPVYDQNRVVVLNGESRDGRLDNFPLLLDDARALARRTRSLERVEFFSFGGAQLVALRDGSRVFRIRRSLVTGGYFQLLGARPVLGRTLLPEDDRTGARPVVVLSYSAWQRYFGGDTAVIGREVVMHETGTAHAIVGIMPLGLDFPRGTDFWAPVIPNSRPLGSYPVYAELNAIGRLRQDASPSIAASELTAYFARPEASSWQREMRGVGRTLTDAILGDLKPAVFAVACAVGLLLLVTCFNVANLLLVRGLDRVREIAVRSALGASRLRIVSELLLESSVLAALGGLLGTALAVACVRGFVALAPAVTPRLDEVQLSGVAVGGAMVITAVVMLLFGIAPAVLSSRVQLQDFLRAGSRHGVSRHVRLGTETLVVVQITLALLVLSGAAVVTRSFIKLSRVELGFDSDRLFLAELSVPVERFGDARKQLAFLDRIVPRLEALPGIRAVTPVLTAPFVDVGGIFGQIPADGQSAAEAAKNPSLTFEVVMPNYFEAFGIPLIKGRAFSENESQGSVLVAMLSESAARHYWPGQDPIGKRLVWNDGKESVTIVGIVPETRYRDLRAPRPTIYFPLHQSSFPVAPMTLAIRTTANPADVVPSIRRALADIDAGSTVASAVTFETLIEAPRAQPRLNALLLTAFSLGAVLLAAVGLGAVMATMVRQRTRELGVRMALGATAFEVGQLILSRGLTLAMSGIAIGLASVFIVNRMIASMLYEVSPTDIPTLAAAAIGLLAVAAAASAVPAWSSTRIEPVTALRSE